MFRAQVWERRDVITSETLHHSLCTSILACTDYATKNNHAGPPLALQDSMSVIRWFLVKLGLLKVKANVLVLGLANSGKTTLVNCLMESDDQEIVPTIGFSMEKFNFDHCKLTVIDMSGQERYQALWEMHYIDAKALVFVVDASDKRSMPQAKAALEAVVTHKETQGLPLLVFANKTDLPESLQPVDIAEQLQLTDPAKRAIHITGCSARRNEGVHGGMKWLAGQLLAA